MLASLSQELVHRQTERQTDTRTWLYVPGRVCTYRHGRGYMYLAVSVHIVYCKAADLCERVDLSLELVNRTD